MEGGGVRGRYFYRLRQEGGRIYINIFTVNTHAAHSSRYCKAHRHTKYASTDWHQHTYL